MDTLWSKLDKIASDRFHPLLRYSADFGAVFQALWEKAFPDASRRHWRDCLGVGEDDAAVRWLSFWASLHDLGKASRVFQGMSQRHRERLQRAGYIFPPSRSLHPLRHNAITRTTFPDALIQASPEGRQLPANAARALACALGSHHGPAAQSSGARRSELLNLQWDDVDTQGQKVRFVGAKGDKTRVVPMAAQLLADLTERQQVRPPSAHRHVFASKSGAPLGKRGLRTALTRALQMAGIDKPGVTTHKLRHTFACMMLRGRADLSCLQRMMGHSRLDTTGIYLSATAEDLKEAMGRHPLSSVSANAQSELVACDPTTHVSGSPHGQPDCSLVVES